MADLLSLIGTPLRRVATTNGGEYAGACPFCGGKDRFRAWPQTGRWWCRQCDRKGDAIDLLRERDGLTYRQALEALHAAPHLGAPPARSATPKRAPIARTAEAPPDDWQTRAAMICAECTAALWSAGGAKARAYLAERGLTDDTLRAWQIGYNGKEREIAGLYVPHGIVIPCLVDGKPWYLKVRRPVPPLPPPKYQQVKGGRPALFGADHLTGKAVVVLCEGEFDALLVWQEAGDLVDVAALGSASTRPTPAHLIPLLGALHWLLAADCDDAGERTAEVWGEYSARVMRVRPLQGNDLTDFWRAGGNLRAWITDCLERLGRRPAAGPFEAEAEALLAEDWRADPAGWARRWAGLAQRAGWPCWGKSWQEWADDVARKGAW